jgi:predicted MPP superfamily phosphohydrolase
MNRFRVVFFGVTALAHVLVAVALTEAAALLESPLPPWIIGTTIAAALCLTLRGRVRLHSADRPLPRWRVLLLEEPYYAHWTASILTLLSFPIAGLVALIANVGLGKVELACYAFMLALSVYGVYVRRRWVRVREIEVPIAGLPQSFDGYRIAHLSDLHIGGLWPRERAEVWVRRVRELDVDLVALTGDYVTRGEAFHADIVELLASFSARDGSLAVMGNHDYFGDGEALARKLVARGVRLLRNERTEIVRGESALAFAGVDDTWTHRDDVARTLDGHDTTRPLVALAHDPRLFLPLARGGASLVLSGHTHWGQVALPFFARWVNPSRFSYRHHAGLYREGGATLYVTPGLGTTGPTVRIGAPPEISLLRLRAA